MQPRLSLALCLLGAVACVSSAHSRAQPRAARRPTTVTPTTVTPTTVTPKSVTAAAHSTAPAARHSRSVSLDRWFSLISDSRRSSSTGGAGAATGSWFPRAVPLELPIDGEHSVPVLVLPVPVPVPADGASCSANAPTAPSAVPAVPAVPAPPAAVPVPSYSAIPPLPFLSPTTEPAGTPSNSQPPYSLPDPSGSDYTSSEREREPISYDNEAPQGESLPMRRIVVPVRVPRPRPYAPPSDILPEIPPPLPIRRTPVGFRQVHEVPRFETVENSAQLVEWYRLQVPREAHLPPVLLNGQTDVTADSEPSPTCTEPELSSDKMDPPPPPRFERSLYLRARLYVPRAEYTEPYELWWDAASGSSRVDFHGGTSSSYRNMRTDGRVQSAQLVVDRTGEAAETRHCVVSGARRLSLSDRAMPALPMLDGFSFSGYLVTRRKRTVERWQQTLTTHPGEHGAARGETLTFRHELLVLRDQDGLTPIPLRYTLAVDSSVLGVDSDGYVHHYETVEFRNHDPSLFRLDVGEACERVEVTERMDRVEPLREFTMLYRDPAHDRHFDEFKRRYPQRYIDDTEEAVRKTVLIQKTRYQASGNREGATFKLGRNFLSDRLQVEVERLTGAAGSGDIAGTGELSFPHSAEELRASHGRLPARWDWRRLGGVTPVRTQILCSCCWAIATTGAVEGALFAQTGRLVQLSEQAIVDCAGPYDGHGCNNTWPRSAYDYTRERGLPAYDDYSYIDKVQQCRASSVQPVTRIGGYYTVTANNVDAIKVAIKRHGPTVVLIDALKTPSFADYKEGFYDDGRCLKNVPNHAVLAVGWTNRQSTNDTYLILKNSWSSAWGEEGYIRVRANVNTCGVLSRPSVPRLEREHVARVPAGAAAAAPSL